MEVNNMQELDQHVIDNTIDTDHMTKEMVDNISIALKKGEEYDILHPETMTEKEFDSYYKKRYNL